MKNKLILLLLIFINTAQAADGEKRIALIIGNANYTDKIGQLQNPKNDASDMAEALQDLGFEVISGINLSRRQMFDKINQFETRLRSGDPQKNIGLFYYAGHGMEIDGTNYLLPVDADIQWQEQVSEEGVQLNRIIKLMNQSNNRMNIVILDACRNNPLPKKPFKMGRSVSTGGWSKVQNVAKGMFIAYGTSEGRQSLDGSGRNGVFTKNLLKNIKTHGLLLEQVFKKTREGVLIDTNDKQLTDQSNRTIGDFYFNRLNIIPIEELNTTSPNNSTCVETLGTICVRAYIERDINNNKMVLEFIRETIQLALNNNMLFWERILLEGETTSKTLYDLVEAKQDINILVEMFKELLKLDGLEFEDHMELLEVFEFYKDNDLNNLYIKSNGVVEYEDCNIFGFETYNCKMKFVTLGYPNIDLEEEYGESIIYIFDDRFYWTPNGWF